MEKKTHLKVENLVALPHPTVHRRAQLLAQGALQLPPSRPRLVQPPNLP